MEALGQQMAIISSGCSAAVLGATIRGIVGLPIATRTGRITGITTSVFALCVPRRGLFRSPLLYSTIALYPLSFSLPWREAPRII